MIFIENRTPCPVSILKELARKLLVSSHYDLGSQLKRVNKKVMKPHAKRVNQKIINRGYWVCLNI